MNKVKYSLIASGYTDEETGNGIYFIGLDDKGKGTVTYEHKHSQNPSYFHYVQKEQKLYMANEVEDTCKVDSYAVSSDKLTLEKSLELTGSGLCHLLYDEKRDRLYASNYGTGEVYCIDKDLEKVHGKALTQITGINSRAHGGAISNNGRWLITVDLGRSCLELYDLQTERPLQEQLIQRVDLGQGTGPRELQINEEKNKLYVVNEHEDTLGVYEFDSKKGRITREISRLKTSLQTTNTKNYPSSSLISKNGNWLLLSNRGHNTISIFKINQQGIPTLVKEHKCHGDWPRYISLTKDEKFLLVTNQNSHQITILNYQQETATLTLADNINIPNPSCITQWR